MVWKVTGMVNGTIRKYIDTPFPGIGAELIVSWYHNWIEVNWRREGASGSAEAVNYQNSWGPGQKFWR